MLLHLATEFAERSLVEVGSFPGPGLARLDDWRAQKARYEQSGMIRETFSHFGQQANCLCQEEYGKEDSPNAKPSVQDPHVTCLHISQISNPSFHVSSQALSQDPRIWVCGGPTGTVCSPNTTVLEPWAPENVQNPPPTELIEETARGLAVISLEPCA